MKWLKHGPWWRWLLVSALLILADQWTKHAVQRWFEGRQAPVEITTWFNVVLAYNRGAAFSLLSEGVLLPRILFSVIALVASIVLLIMMRKATNAPATQLALALILGGALGNLWDRCINGAVVDFIQWHWDDWAWPAFNVADSGITVGAVLLVFLSLLRPRSTR